MGLGWDPPAGDRLVGRMSDLFSRRPNEILHLQIDLFDAGRCRPSDAYAGHIKEGVVSIKHAGVDRVPAAGFEGQ